MGQTRRRPPDHARRLRLRPRLHRALHPRARLDSRRARAPRSYPLPGRGVSNTVSGTRAQPLRARSRKRPAARAYARVRSTSIERLETRDAPNTRREPRAGPPARAVLRTGVPADVVAAAAALVVDVDGRTDLHPGEDRGGVGDGHAQTAVASRVDGHFGVAVDGVAADEVVGVDHALFVRARRLGVDVEVADHGRRGGLAGADLIDRAHATAGFDLGEHLAGEVGLDVAAIAAVADVEGARAALERFEDATACVGHAFHSGG